MYPNENAPIEQEMLHILEQASDLRASAAIGSYAYSRWPFRYHLSPERSRLISHLCFDGLDVCELSAEMGGLSRSLAERARTLTAVDASEKRIAVVRARLRDLQNWTAVAENPATYETDKRFDVVCLLSQLKNAASLYPQTDARTAAISLLRHARSLLNENGVVVLASENRMGMKYWNGSPEEDSATLFYGIAGYPDPSPIRTYAKEELEELCVLAGLRVAKSYYPFPDHKLPDTMMTDAFVSEYPEKAARVAMRQSFAHPVQQRTQLLPDSLLIAGVAQARLLSQLTNSVLLVATAGDLDIAEKLCRDTEVAWTYAGSRKAPVCTKFVRDGKSVRVDKRSIDDPSAKTLTFQAKDAAFEWRRCFDDMIEGEEVFFALVKQAYYGQWEAFNALLLEFLTWSFQTNTVDDENLDGAALDAVITNTAMRDVGDDRFVLFDREWRAVAPISKTWFIFRNVYMIGKSQDRFPGADFATFARLYERLCVSFHLTPTLDADMDREARFQAAVTHIDASEARAALDMVFHRPITQLRWLKHAVELTTNEKLYRGIEEQAALVRHDIALLESQLREKWSQRNEDRSSEAQRNFAFQEAVIDHLNMLQTRLALSVGQFDATIGEQVRMQREMVGLAMDNERSKRHADASARIIAELRAELTAKDLRLSSLSHRTAEAFAAASRGIPGKPKVARLVKKILKR